MLKTVKFLRRFKLEVGSLWFGIKQMRENEIRFRSAMNLGLISIGEHSYGRPSVWYWDQSTKLRVGKYCSIASGVTVLLGGEHLKHCISTYPFYEFLGQEFAKEKSESGHPATKGDVIIGNDVWIGQDSLILSGVTIGDGCVIGAGSVVTRTLPSYAIAVGNPASVVGFRFNQDVISTLLELKWWDLPMDLVWKNIGMLTKEPSKESLIELERLRHL